MPGGLSNRPSVTAFSYAGRCAQTTLVRAQVVLVPRDEGKPGFWILVRSPFAGYLAEWLLDATSEYGSST